MRTLVLLSLLCFTVCTSVMASSFTPVINNLGFEEGVPGNDAPGWAWYARAQTEFHLESRNPHSGARCLAFSNKSPLAPEVYGRLYQYIGVFPNTKYELSVWVRGDDVADGLHFSDWNSYTLNIPSGTYGWRRISTVFTTKDGQTGLNVGINVVNKCKELAIDDVWLVPVGTQVDGDGASATLLAPGQVYGDNTAAYIRILVTSKTNGKVEAKISADNKTILEKSKDIQSGESSVEWEWNTGTVSAKALDCSVRVLDPQGKVVAQISRPISKVSPGIILSDIDRVQARMKELDSLYEECRAKGISLDYPTTARTMLAQFIPLARRDAITGEDRRANYAIKDFNRSVDEAITTMKAYLSDPKSAPDAVRYKTSRLDIKGTSFIGDKIDSNGNKSRGPVFFCGYGHFNQVRKDMSKWPGYGVNIIQVEVGPSVTLIEENKVSLAAVKDIARVLDNAAKNNVKVNVLLSPHYFPEWAMKKWPHLANGGGGFLGYCVDAPEAKQVIEKFLRTVVPLLKDKPALHSFCLSNEPIFDRGAQANNTRPMWSAYLAKVHGSVEEMNQRYGTSYKSFDEVPVPGNADYGAPQFYDWCIFNQERFAGWHKWMADIIHEMAPNVPVHAKAMWIPISWRQSVSLGLNPELFGQLSDINGNDCTIWPGGGDWGISWGEQNMYYDLQRSVARKPIFNSENHIQPDGSTSYVPPEHYRTALWQGAIHGQGATTIWVWERALPSNDPNYAATAPFYGNVMDRPGCAQVVGTTCLDLNRFADEVTALQNVKAPAAILYSMTTFTRNDNFLGVLSRAYSALNFCGIKVDFISDKQLAAGEGANYKMVILPDTTNVPNATLQGLSKLPESTRIMVIGDSLKKDPYNNPASDALLKPILERAIKFPANADAEMVLWPALQNELDKLGALPRVQVVDAETGKPAWGVEWLTVKIGRRTLINIVNLKSTPVDVKVLAGGREIKAKDLLSLGSKEEVRQLKPITPVLAEL